MKAVLYRMTRTLRAQWRATLALTAIVAAVSGGVLAFATGAERTASAPDRYTSSRGDPFDGAIQQTSGPPRTAEVAALPGVSSVAATTFLFGGLALPGTTDAPDAFTFAGSPLAFDSRLVAGRTASRPGEFVATRSFADAEGVGLGATFAFQSLTQEQADRAGYEAFGSEGPQGLSVEAVLVGIIAGPTEFDDPTPLAMFPASLLDQGDVAVSATIMSVRLRPGIDLATFRDQLDTLPGGGELSLAPAVVVSSGVRTAVDAQALGLWLLAGVAAAAAVAVLGQLVTRSVRLTADERTRLMAIGFSRGQLLAESAGRAAVPIVTGTVVGVAVAVAASGAFPTGFVRSMDPDAGVWIDPTVLALSTAGLLVTLMVWTTASLAGQRPARGAGRPSALVESVAARSGSATLATGFRFAFTPARRDRGSVRASLAGMLVTIALVVGAIVFGSSLGRLVSDGARYGHNFDLMLGSGGVVPDELRATLAADPDITALLLYAVGQARVGPRTIQLAGMDPVKGDLAPTVLTGRLPAADDEIALGRLVANTLGTDVGADLTLEGESSTQRFRVTGLAVVPPVEGLDGVGQDAILTLGGLTRLDPAATPSVAAIAVGDEGRDRVAASLDGGGGYDIPTVIVNLTRIRSIPFLLASLIGALAVLTVVHVMVTSFRNRRRDLAVLRSLGADGRWISRAVHWQATTFSLVPLALGLPLGMIVGRLVFETFASSVGAVPDASFPYVLIIGVLIGLVVLANAVAAVPAHHARHLAPAPLLTGE